MNKLQEIVWAASKRARQKRAAIFRRKFNFNETTRILDIGSENGENISLVLSGTKVNPKNVFIADIDTDAIKYGGEKFGYQTILLDESGILPFDDKSFDLLFLCYRTRNDFKGRSVGNDFWGNVFSSSLEKTATFGNGN